jgi:hypothetical protein
MKWEKKEGYEKRKMQLDKERMEEGNKGIKKKRI